MKKILLILLLIFLSSFALAGGGGEGVLELDYPGIESTTPLLSDYVLYIFNFVYGIFGVIILLSIIYAGLKYIFSVGNSSKTQEAKERIKNSFLGFLILLFSFLILYTINPNLVTFETVLDPIGTSPFYETDAPPIEEPDLIVKEIPMGKVIQQALQEEDRESNREPLGEMKDLRNKIEGFLTKEKKLDDPGIPTSIFDNMKEEYNRIADLSKYLKKLTEQCKTANLVAICGESESWSRPQGCLGDVCILDQHGNDEVRENMNEVIDILKNKSIKENGVIDITDNEFESLLQIPPTIKKYVANYQERINRLALASEEMAFGKETLVNLSQHYSRISNLEQKQDWTVKEVPLFEEVTAEIKKENGDIRKDPLTFYQDIGGSGFDEYPSFDRLSATEPKDLKFETETELICDFAIPLGELIDKTLQTGSAIIVKTESLTPLIEKKADNIIKLIRLAQQCDESDVTISCSHLPNPCYGRCENPFCAPFCRSAGGQSGGSCHGPACPTEEIEETVEKIKELEKEIFAILREIEVLMKKSPLLLGEEEEEDSYDYKYNLKNTRNATTFCVTPKEFAKYSLLDARDASFALDSDGQVIVNPHPRNLYCCASLPEPVFTEVPSSLEELAEKNMNLFPKKNDYSKDSCPEGNWEYDLGNKTEQCEDSSEPLNQLLACMDDYLSAKEEVQDVSKGLNVNEKIGRIVAITDENLYNDKCDWLKGGNCNYPYVYSPMTEQGVRISSHYGGPRCRYFEESYAVKIGLDQEYEKDHIETIINAAQACDERAYVVYAAEGYHNQLHISIARPYYCGVN